MRLTFLGGRSAWLLSPPPWVQSQSFSKTGRGSSCWESRSGSPSSTCLGPSDPSQDLGEVESWGCWGRVQREGQTHADCGPSFWCPPMAQLGHRLGRMSQRRAA